MLLITWNGARFILALSLLFLLALSSTGVSGRQASRRPNIIFILADDLGYGDLGCYGQQLTRTPRLDQMAAEGMRFSDFYAGCPVCAPSRATLLTGYHTGHSYIRTNTSPPPDLPLRKEDITIAEVLKDAGYATGVVGKWGLGSISSSGSPNRQGFDYFFGFDEHSAGNYFPTTLCRNEQIIDVAPGAYQQDLFAGEALDFIRRERDHPFFLYLAFMVPHAPYEIPSLDPYRQEPWTKSDRAFAAMVTYMDRNVGQIFDLLKELDLDDNTIVFFSSDNGPEATSMFQNAGPLNGIKRTLYEGGIRIPFIARWPGHIASAQVISEPFAFWDVMKTVAGLGETTVGWGDGASFLRTLLGETQRLSRPLYWEFPIKNGLGFMQAVRLGKWKGVKITSLKGNRAKKKTFQLYDLSVDLSEDNDVAAQHPEIVQEMQAIMIKEHVDQ